MSNKGYKLKYVAFYNINYNQDENRITFLAINNKVNYICRTLIKNGYEVEIISPSWTNNNSGYFKGNLYKIQDGMEVRLFDTFGSKNNFTKKLKYVYSVLQLLIYLLTETKRNEQIIVYHSLALCTPIRIAKFLRGLKIILEVEELYSAVWKNYNMIKEKNYILAVADKCIFASDILKKQFKNKRSIVLYGGYEVIDKIKESKGTLSTINLVYAGSIDDTKGGAINAVLCMKYLPNNYKMHILGFGNQNVVQKLKREIKNLNNIKEYECCIYHGALVGDEYKCFLQKCDIGVNPQYQGEYMNFAFPSKVLAYLSHNLIVVSTRIKSIQESKVSQYIYFSKNDSPLSIAEVIKSININASHNNAQLINELDQEFLKSLDNLLNK